MKKLFAVLAVMVMLVGAGLVASNKRALGAAPALDQYGGRADVNCTGGVQARFYTEKIGSRWYLCTPAGHPMWAQGAYAVGPQGNSTVKYGSDAAANQATIARLKAWGFNFLDTYSSAYVQPWSYLLPATSSKMGTIVIARPGAYGISASARPNDPFPAGTLDQNIKDVENGMSPYFTSVKTGVPDWGDLKRMNTALNYLLTKTQSTDPGGIAPAIQNNNSLDYIIGVAVEDSDQTWAYFTSGENDPFDTQPSGKGSAHGGYVTAIMAPQQQADALQKSFYNLDQTVYVKKDWHDFLVNKYGTIAALNAAWGSNYTTFDSSATLVTGEAVGTTDGTSYQFSHTIAHAGALTPNSIQIYQDGVMAAGDCFHPNRSDVCNPAGGTDSGALYGSSVSGYVTYSGGKVNVTYTANWQWPGTVNCIAGVSCTVSFPNYQDPGFQVGDHITVQGFPNTNFAVSNAAVTARTVGPATFSGPWCSPTTDPNSFNITFAWSGGTVTNSGYCGADTGKMAKITIPAAGHTLSINYQVNGWDAGGTGLMDEDGRPTHTWLGTDPYALTTTNPSVATDLRAFLYQLDHNYFSSMRSGVQAAFTSAGRTPPMYLGPDTLGTWNSTPRKEVLQAASDTVDLALFSAGGQYPLTQPMLNFVAQWYGKPILAASFLHADPDSPFSSTVLDNEYQTQAARGAAFYSGIQSMLSATTTFGINPYTGYGWWQYGDNQSEGTNWGLVTLKDNAYDGHESVTSTVPCSPPINSYLCGGEAGDYGDVITSVKAANTLWFNSVSSSDTTAPSVPTNLSAAPVSTSQADLSWTASADPDNSSTQIDYQIYRNGSLIVNTAAGTTSYTDTGLAPGTVYSYSVSASDLSGNTSAQSSAVSATTWVAGSGPISFVQADYCYAGSVGSCSNAFGINTTAGNLLAVHACWSTVANTSTVTDSQGDAFTPATGVTVQGNGIACQLFYAKNIHGGNTRVAMALSNSPIDWPVFEAVEYSGLDAVSPLDAVSASSGASGDPTSGFAATHFADELIFGGAACPSGGPLTAENGFALRPNSQNNAAAAEDEIVSTIGTYAATFSNNVNSCYNGGWAAQMATFKGSATSTIMLSLSNVAASAITSNSASISWTTSAPTNGQVDYGLTSAYGLSSPLVDTNPLATSHSVPVSGLSSNATYHYQVVSQDSLGNTVLSADNTFTTLPAPDATPPNAITDLSASGLTQSSANLSWTAPTDPDNTAAAAYDLRYAAFPITASNWGSATPVSGEPVPAAGGTQQTYTLAGLSASTAYYAAMTATDAAGNVSGLSDVASFSTQAAAVPPVINSFTATPASITLGQSSVLSWDVSNATQVAITPGSFVSASSTGSTSVAPSSTTTYTLTASNSAYFTTAQTTVSVAGAVAPVLSNVNASASGLTVTVTWTTDQPSTEQVSYGTTTSLGSSSPLGSTLATAHTVTFYNLPKKTKYYYRALSTNSSGLTGYSPILSFTTTGKANVPGGPVITVSLANEGQVAGASAGSVSVDPVSGFTASPLDSQAYLRWTNPTNPAYVRTVIVRKQGTVAPSSPTDGTKVYEGTGSSFVDTGLQNGTAYSYAAWTLGPALSYSAAATATATPQTGLTQISIPAQPSSTPSALQALLQQLQSQLNSLIQQAIQQGIQLPPGLMGQYNGTIGSANSSFSRTLSRGTQGSDVKLLQQLLIKDGDLAPNLDTGAFGSLTEQALQKFQAKNNIVSSGVPATTGFGMMGPRTRAALEQLQ